MPTSLLKNHLIEILEGRSVHCGIDQVLEGIPFELWGKPIESVPFTLYQLLEHLRLSTKDILDYIVDPDYKAEPWPEGYWPKSKRPRSPKEVQECVHCIRNDVNKLIKLLKTDSLLDPLPYGEKGHTLTREALILSNHLAYHLGQMVLMRRLLGIWEAA